VGGSWLSVARAGRKKPGIGDFLALVSLAGLVGMVFESAYLTVNGEYSRVRARIQSGVLMYRESQAGVGGCVYIAGKRRAGKWQERRILWLRQCGAARSC
jgi:hypothetical protein